MSEKDIDAVDDPVDDIERWLVEDTAKVTQLVTELRTSKRRVFFYAASGLDWQPLHRFTHLCDTFVFVDPRNTEAEFKAAWQQVVDHQTNAGDKLVTSPTNFLSPFAAYEIFAKVTGELLEMRNEAWARIPNLQDRPAWGAIQRLRRHVGGATRDIWLVFIAGSPLVAYRKLFIEAGTAPECLAIHMPEFPDPVAGMIEAPNNPHGHLPIQQEWAAYAGWNGELGHLLRDNDAPKPRLLVANDLMAWPAHSLHYVIPKWRSGWKTNVHKMSNDPWPDLAPAPGAGGRRVVVTRKLINPHHARAVGAVVVTSEKYHLYRWPAGVLVIISTPPVYPEHAVPDGHGVVNLNIEGVPLLQALARVEAVCAEHGVTTVAVQRLPGFEDEAADLALWRQQEGQIKELIVHLNCDGHLIDFAPVADVID